MAAAGADTRGGESWRAAPLTTPRDPGKLPRPGRRAGTRGPGRARRGETPPPTLETPGAPDAPHGLHRSLFLTLLAARPARSPHCTPAPWPARRDLLSRGPVGPAAAPRPLRVEALGLLPRLPLLPGGGGGDSSSRGRACGLTPLWWFERVVECSGWLCNWEAGRTLSCKCDLSSRKEIGAAV